ncbi:MAG: hypothetical protein ACLU84_06960 [Clostridia bacterium]
MNERECYEKVLEEVKVYINQMYAYFKQNRPEMQIKDEEPEKQLEEIITKRYLSPTYMTDLVYASSCLFEGEDSRYQSCLDEYKVRVEIFLDR